MKTDPGVIHPHSSVRDVVAITLVAAVYLGHILCVVFSAQTYFLLWVAVSGERDMERIPIRMHFDFYIFHIDHAISIYVTTYTILINAV